MFSNHQWSFQLFYSMVWRSIQLSDSSEINTDPVLLFGYFFLSRMYMCMRSVCCVWMYMCAVASGLQDCTIKDCDFGMPSSSVPVYRLNHIQKLFKLWKDQAPLKFTVSLGVFCFYFLKKFFLKIKLNLSWSPPLMVSFVYLGDG